MAEVKNFGKWVLNNLTGILAVVSGLILLGLTYKIILNLILFTVGIMLTYFGLVKINATPVVNFVNKIVRSLKSNLNN